MKLVRLLMVFALLGSAGGVACAEAPAAPAIKGIGVGDANTALTELLSNSHWAWYEGPYENYTKNSPHWIEFYKDGTARVPWRDHAQFWKLADNVVTVLDSGTNGDKHTFTMNLENKSGSSDNQSLHIRYEKKASKPPRWK